MALLSLGPDSHTRNFHDRLEGRPQEKGRNVLCRHAPDDAKRSERDGVDVTPAGSNARTRVHEYGGGAVVLGGGGRVYYSEFADQRLHELVDGSSRPITEGGDRYRFADGVVTPDGTTMYCVREDHKDPHPSKVVNEVVAVDLGSGSIQVIATGNDFYGAPRLSPDGKRVAYITWNHPSMPWDATELRVAELGGGGNESGGHELVAGEFMQGVA